MLDTEDKAVLVEEVNKIMLSASAATEKTAQLCKCFVDYIPSVDAVWCGGPPLPLETQPPDYNMGFSILAGYVCRASGRANLPWGCTPLASDSMART